MISDKQIMSYVAALPPDNPIALMAGRSKRLSTRDRFYSGVPGVYTLEAPVANILHNINRLPHEMTLYLNYKPSDIELGMAWRAGEIKNVFFVESRDPLVIGQYKINRDGFALHTPCELIGVKVNNIIEQELAETLEPKLAEAFSPLNTFSERIVSPETTEALGRGLDTDFVIPEVLDQRKIDEDFMRIAIALVDRGWNSSDATTKPADRVAGNNIGAIMVDKDNKIIGWGLNLKSENRTFHAETLMIQRYLKENKTDRLPDGVRIYTSLECCHMCSAHITTLGKDIKVIYAQKDPYFNGDNTLSQGKGNCTQERTSLHFPDIFKAAMESDEDILEFLFSAKAKSIFNKGFQDAALFIELMEAVAKRKEAKKNNQTNQSVPPKIPNVSPILQYGEQFFQELGDYTPHSPTLPSPTFFRSRSSSSSPSSSRSSSLAPSPSPSPSLSPSPSRSPSPAQTPNLSTSPETSSESEPERRKRSKGKPKT